MSTIGIGLVLLNLIILLNLYLINKEEQRNLEETMSLLKDAEQHEQNAKRVLKEAQEYYARGNKE